MQMDGQGIPDSGHSGDDGQVEHGDSIILLCFEDKRKSLNTAVLIISEKNLCHKI